MTLRDGLVVAFLLVQLVLPLHYYTVREDRFDERFSWRMFSDIRMIKCQASFHQAGRPIKLSGEFHMAWNTLVGRGRGDVIDAVGQELCDTAGEDPVTLRLACRLADGTRQVLSDGSDNLCVARD